MDGISQWEYLLNGSNPKRTEVLHNIDDIYGYYGLRKNSYKLVKGKKESIFVSNTDLF